jgi:hypothetical protein
MAQGEAKRFKKRPIIKISNTNKDKQVVYGRLHVKRGFSDWRQYVYLTDEVHFNSVDLTCKTQYELRQLGELLSRQLQEKL